MARGKVNAKQDKTDTNKSKKRTKQDAAVAAEETKADAASAKAEKVQVNKGKGAAAKKNPRIARWEEPEQLVLLEGWARAGLSMEQIAHNMGISKDTIYRWLKLSPYISDAIKKGKEVVDFMVENALFTSALAGNVVAQIFWLKNRKPDAWQDKVEQKIEADVEQSGGVVMLAPRLEEDHE